MIMDSMPSRIVFWAGIQVIEDVTDPAKNLSNRYTRRSDRPASEG